MFFLRGCGFSLVFFVGFVRLCNCISLGLILWIGILFLG